MTIDELHDEMIHRFEKVDARIDKVDARIDRVDARIDRVDAEFGKLRAEMKTEHETTRRHFQVWAEKISDSVKIVAEATAHHTVRIDNHEKRLKRLERPRRS